jgi:tetratricopeptide (TPR) repeat protein
MSPCPRKSNNSGKASALLLALLAVLLIISKSAFAQIQRTGGADSSACTTPAAGSDTSEACGLLNQGIRAFQAGDLDIAIEAFKQAKTLEPTLIKAHLSLAMAYASRYVPGAASEENASQGQQAVEEYKEVLTGDPNNLTAIDGIAAVLFNMAGGSPPDLSKLSESKYYRQRHLAVQNDDPEPYYWIGVIDWDIANQANKDLRASSNLESPEKPVGENDAMPPAKAIEFRADNAATIEDGITHLTMAIDRRPEYDDAMAYLNLLYRQKADTETTPEARAADIQAADDLVDKAKAIKKHRAKNCAPPPTKGFDSN